MKSTNHSNTYDALMAAIDAVDARSPAEARLLGYLRALARLGRAAIEKPEDWLSMKLSSWQSSTEFGALQMSAAAATFSDVFAARYATWAHAAYGRDVSYVSGAADRKALATEIVPYLRERSGGSTQRALEIWQRIVENYFRSKFATERAQFHLLKDIAPWLQALELSPVGAEEEVEIGDEGRSLVAHFRRLAPAGRVRSKDVVELLRRAGSYEEAVRGLEWMYSAEADEYVRSNRPWSLGFVVTIWDRYEQSRPSEAESRKRAREQERLLASIRKANEG
jgi:hypothetical protein